MKSVVKSRKTKHRTIQEEFGYKWFYHVLVLLTIISIPFVLNIFGLHKIICQNNPSNPTFVLSKGLNELSLATSIPASWIIGVPYSDKMMAGYINERTIGFPRVSRKDTVIMRFYYENKSSNFLIDSGNKKNLYKHYLINYFFSNNEAENLSELEKLYECFVESNKETFPTLSVKKLMVNAKEEIYSDLNNPIKAHGYCYFIAIFFALFLLWIYHYLPVATRRLKKMLLLHRLCLNEKYKSFFPMPDILSCFFVLNCEKLFNNYHEDLIRARRMARIATSSCKIAYQAVDGEENKAVVLKPEKTNEEQLLSKIEKCLEKAKDSLVPEEFQKFQHLIQDANKSTRKSKREYYLESAFAILSRENPGCIEEKQNRTNGDQEQQIIPEHRETIQITSENIGSFLKIEGLLPEDINEEYVKNIIIWGLLRVGRRDCASFKAKYTPEENIRRNVQSKMMGKFNPSKYKQTIDWLHSEGIILGREYKRKENHFVYSLNPLASSTKSENSAKIIREIIGFKQFIDRETSI